MHDSVVQDMHDWVVPDMHDWVVQDVHDWVVQDVHDWVVPDMHDYVHLHQCVQTVYDYVTFCHLITQSNNTPQCGT